MKKRYLLTGLLLILVVGFTLSLVRFEVEADDPPTEEPTPTVTLTPQPTLPGDAAIILPAPQLPVAVGSSLAKGITRVDYRINDTESLEVIVSVTLPDSCPWSFSHDLLVNGTIVEFQLYWLRDGSKACTANTVNKSVTITIAGDYSAIIGVNVNGITGYLIQE